MSTRPGAKGRARENLAQEGSVPGDFGSAVEMAHSSQVGGRYWSARPKLVDILLSILYLIRDALVALVDIIPLRVRDLIIVPFFAVIFAAAYTGVNQPTIWESSFTNYSFGPITGKQKTRAVGCVMKDMRIGSKFLSIYVQLYHGEGSKQSKGLRAPGQISTRILKGNPKDGNEVKGTFREEVAPYLASGQSAVFRVFSTPRIDYDQYMLNVTSEGSLVEFETSEVSMFYRRNDWVSLHVWKRVVIVLVAILLAVYGRSPYIRPMAFILLARFIPTSLLLLTSDNPLVPVIENMAGDVVSLAVVTLWIVRFGLTKPATLIWALMGPVCAVILLAESYLRTTLEIRNPLNFHRDPAGDLEYIVVGINFGILVFCYFTYLFQGTRIPAHPDRRIDMATYSMFSSRFCHMVDDLISRARFLNCTEIGLDLRIFSEILFVIFFEHKFGWEAADPHLAPVHKLEGE
jgi:hypothetical protein